MDRSLPRVVTLVAIAQFLPLVIFPWSLSFTSLVFVIVLLALSGLLGWALLQRKQWGRMLTIFVQGFNIIVRVITLFGNVYSADSGLNGALLGTYVVSIILSGVILSYIDKAEVQLAFGS